MTLIAKDQRKEIRIRLQYRNSEVGLIIKYGIQGRLH